MEHQTMTGIMMEYAPRPIGQQFLMQLFEGLSAEGRMKAMPILLRACGLHRNIALLGVPNVA